MTRELKDIITELNLTAIYEEAEEGGYIGYIAELPGANTQGETMDEVRENLNEAALMVVECIGSNAPDGVNAARRLR